MGPGDLDTARTDASHRNNSAIGTFESSVATQTAKAATKVRRAATGIGVIVMVLRLMFSRRARRKLEDARRELNSAANELNACLARMAAERRGQRVPLRLIARKD